MVNKLKIKHIGLAIFCYDCNSRTDPRCGDPFDNFSIAQVDCSQKIMPHLNNSTANKCRKITQKVDGTVRVHRSCGWIDDHYGTNCYMRSGTYHVLVEYCACEGDACNAGVTVTPSWTAAAVASAVLLPVLIAAL
ncbi:unnamed protein product [Notodromas monacha]|uniref:Protein sleepless n=1 Tax=Notodromas monacha TaxID=399045 RepID=A0A7R9BTR0_9CRUS|nr:unnamed protein product [Notodromas monacha]CAG0921579.1 unnamed protein product [Notodromas monacha]